MTFAGVAHRARAGRRALGEGSVVLIGQPVVVLDEIGAAEREFMRERGEIFGGEALRLQGRAGQRATFDARQRTQPLHAVVRAAERLEQGRGNFGVLERDVLMHRGVAEQHVEQLSGVRADGARG